MTKPGDSIFIPSGRLHAIGAGFVIYEIQQNSDTTYRVFDWNRVGLNGKPRDLHVTESLQCIDFSDFEPEMDSPRGSTLASCPLFVVDRHELETGRSITNPNPDRFSVLTVVTGSLRRADGHSYHPGDFILLPRGSSALETTSAATVLQTTIPEA